MTGFRLSQRSLDRLDGVHPDLVRVVKRAIGLTEVDFAILEGKRSRDRQHKLFRSGASQTMNSRHLTGHAVDLGAWIDGAVRWDWPPYFKIGEAMRIAAVYEKVPLVWGAAWGRRLTDFKSAELASDTYVDERRAAGGRPFLDGPHYELPWDAYPIEKVAA